jgi:hypothetical protein
VLADWYFAGTRWSALYKSPAAVELPIQQLLGLPFTARRLSQKLKSSLVINGYGSDCQLLEQ